jgi:eukaryotic-like serine/threonine-protein kinase
VRVPPALSEAVLACLRKDPDGRPAAAELALMLQPLVADLPQKLLLGRRGPRRA